MAVDLQHAGQRRRDNPVPKLIVPASCGLHNAYLILDDEWGPSRQAAPGPALPAPGSALWGARPARPRRPSL